MPQLKVLINGGGIAGNALAFWLSKLHHDVTIVERHPNLRATGLQVDLRGHGIEVMKRMGLEQAFQAKQVPEQGLQVVDSKDRQWAYFPVNKSGKGLQSFTTDFEIMRGDLCCLFHDAASKHGAKYIFSTSVESFEQRNNCVAVHFTNDSAEVFDLLVGADGLWSSTRRLLFASGTEGVFSLKDLYNAYFTAPKPMQQGEDYLATIYMAPGKRGIMTRRSKQHEIQVYIGCTTEIPSLKNARKGDADAEKKAFAEIFQGAGWQSGEIVKAMMSAEDFYCERMALVKLETWSKGNVALVGDAAYCPTANTGMGTSSAVVGAYILAGEIGRACGRGDRVETDTKDGDSLVNALKAYEETFRPFMDQVQKGVLDDNGVFPATAFGVALTLWLAWIASLLRLDLGRWFLKEGVKGWKLPEYEEMLRD